MSSKPKKPVKVSPVEEESAVYEFLAKVRYKRHALVDVILEVNHLILVSTNQILTASRLLTLALFLK